MANVTTGNHLYFDSAGSVSGRHRIIGLFWTGISGAEIVADNDLSITDASGKSIIAKRAKSNGDDLGISPPLPMPVDGITIATLDSGVVHIWLA